MMRLLVYLILFVLGPAALAQPIMRDATGTPICDALTARLRACPAEQIAVRDTPRAWQTPDTPPEQQFRRVLSGLALLPMEAQRYRQFRLLPRDPRLDAEQTCAELSDWLPTGC